MNTESIVISKLLCFKFAKDLLYQPLMLKYSFDDWHLYYVALVHLHSHSHHRRNILRLAFAACPPPTHFGGLGPGLQKNVRAQK